MMPTDDERREVAGRLRSLRATGRGMTSVGHGYLWSLLWAASSDELGGSCPGDWFERFCARLADLIEPDTTSDTTSDMTKCDREALLALADECDEMRDDGCAIGSYELYRVARRIREACGEAANGLPARGTARTHAPGGKAQAGGAGRGAGAGARHEKN